MALFKEIWEFASPPAFKWSEVYYRSQSSVEGIVPLPKPLIAARQAILDNQNTFVRVRFSDVKVPRKTTEQRIGVTGNSDDPGNVAPANAVESAVILLAATAVPARRKLWLRGVPESSLSRDLGTGADLINPEYNKAIDNFIAQLAKSQYLIAVTQKPGEGEIILKQIVSADGTAGNGTTILTMSGGIGAVAGDWIIVRKGNAKRAPGLSGTFQVLASNPETFTYTIRYRTPGNVLLEKIPLGEAYKRNYLETAVISSAVSGFQYIGARQTKNPNTGSRGARRAVRLRNLA